MSGIARWEYWIYAGVDGGIELTFVKEFDARGYDYAPFPSGLALWVATELVKLEPGPVMRDAAIREPTVYDYDLAELPVQMHYDVAGFRGPGTSGRLEIYSGLSASEAARLGSGLEAGPIALDRTVALFDGLWDEAYRASDQVVFEPPTQRLISQDAFIPGILPVDLAPGPYLMVVQVTDPASGGSLVHRQRVDLADLPRRRRPEAQRRRDGVRGGAHRHRRRLREERSSGGTQVLSCVSFRPERVHLLRGVWPDPGRLRADPLPGGV